MPIVDLVVGPQSYHRLPAMMEAVGRVRERSTPSFRPRTSSTTCPTAQGREGPTAFLTVQEGCDKFCAFCVVPYTRGAEVSRPRRPPCWPKRAIWWREGCARSRCWARTSTPITGGPDGDWGLARLLRELARIEGLERIRYTTCHPNDMEDDLIAAHGD